MATGIYEKIEMSDPEDKLPPPPVILERDPDVEPTVPVSFPPPPPSPTTHDVQANSTVEHSPTKSDTTAAGVKGTQLVKVSGLKLGAEELSNLNLTEGDLYLATEVPGSVDQWQVCKPENESEKNLQPKKAFKVIDKNTIDKNEKYDLVVRSVQSPDPILLDTCLSQNIFSPVQKGLGNNGASLYHVAAIEGNPHNLVFLMGKRAGADGNKNELMIRDASGATLLHAAAAASKTDNIEVILDHLKTLDAGIRTELINAQENDGNTALAIAISQQRLDAVNILLRSDSCKFELVNRLGESVFHISARMDDVDSIRALMQAYLDREPLQQRKIGLKDELSRQTTSGLMPLTMSHSPEMIRLLLPNYELNIAEYPHQSTLLHISIASNNTLLTEILLEEGAQPDVATSLGHTPLMLACRAGYKEVTVLLLEKGADTEQILKNSDHESECTGTAIEMAALNGHLECVKLLLQFSATVSGDGSTPEHRIGALQASCLGGDEQTVIFFVREQGMDPNLRNSLGYTSLFYAVKGNHSSVVELLLTSGADPAPILPSQKDESDSSLLHIVIEQDSEKILALLLLHSKVDTKESLLDQAIRLDRKRLLTQLLTSKQEILLSGRQNGSLLHTAVSYHSQGSLSYLLARISKSNSPSAMHFQIFERKATILSKPHCKSKSSVYPERSQKTVFELALEEKSEPMLSLLLTYLRDEEYFCNNKALLHSMLDRQLYAPLKTAMDTMVVCADDKVSLHTSYLDSDSTGLLPTNPDYQESDKSLLHKLISCPDQDLVYHSSVTAAVSYKLPYYRALFIISALLYIFFLLFLSLALHRASYVCNQNLFDYQRDPFRLFSEIIVGIFFVVYVAYEVLNFLIEWDPLRSRYVSDKHCSHASVTYIVETTNEYRITRAVHKVTKFTRCVLAASWRKLNQITRGLFSAILSYLLNPFRLLAFLSLLSLFFFFMLRLGMSSSQWTFAALALLFFYLSLLEYSKIFPNFYCYLLRILRASCQALPHFLLLLTICVLAFVLAGHLFIQQSAIQDSDNRTANCLPLQEFLTDPYSGTNRLFVSSLAMLLQSGISSYEDRFEFRDNNWVFLLYLLCFGFLFAVLLPAFLLAQILFSFTQHQGCLSLQRCKLDIIYRTELHSGFAFLFGRKVRSSTCVSQVQLPTESFNIYLDKVSNKRETEILTAMKSNIGKVLYTSQGTAHKKILQSPQQAEVDIDSSLKSLVEGLRTDLQENTARNNSSVSSMFVKMDELDRRVATIHDYLTGVSVEIVT